jgi:hypothetical protein
MPYSMMGGMSTFALLMWLVIFVDLVLLGMWLWKHIK